MKSQSKMIGDNTDGDGEQRTQDEDERLRPFGFVIVARDVGRLWSCFVIVASEDVLLGESGFVREKRLANIKKETGELKGIFGSIARNTKAKSQRPKR